MNRVALWRRSLLLLCALGALLTVYDARTYLTRYTFGVHFSQTSIPLVRRVVVEPGGPAARAGLHTGDILQLRALSPAQRRAWLAPGGPVTQDASITVERDHSLRMFTLHSSDLFRYARPPFVDWAIIASNVGDLWTIAFVALIAWRRPESSSGRVLALSLALSIFGLGLSAFSWHTPWPSLDVAANCAAPFLASFAVVLLAVYASLFARPLSTSRRLLTWLTYGLAGLQAAYGLASTVALWSGSVDPDGPAFPGPLAQALLDASVYFVSLLCAFAAFGAARGSERGRITWAVIPLSVLYVMNIIYPLYLVLAPGDLWHPWITALANASSFLAPLGLTYSLLNRRLLDIGFALNRAAVFSGVTIVVVGSFVLAEWIATRWFEGATHTQNIALSALLALAFGLSLRAIHRRVDHSVDRVFFRKRHDDELAIRNFSEETLFITDRTALLERTASVLERHADASFVTTVLDDGSGRFGEVGENDPAIVALRARRSSIYLHDFHTRLAGELAFPLVIRGIVCGALALGPKRSGDSYAPDEMAAIAELCHNVATGLNLVSNPGRTSDDRVLAAIETLTEETRSLHRTIVAAQRPSV